MSEVKSGSKPEIKREKLVVEIGSGQVPAALTAKRRIRKDEHYVTVNIVDRQANFEKKLHDASNFSPTIGDGSDLAFGNGTVDELIYTNVFGDNQIHKVSKVKMLKEAARVIARTGRIVVTETITPLESNFLINHLFLDQVGLRIVSTSENVKDIERYHDHRMRTSSSKQFQYVLAKI
ncbi:MAG: hypothetical protein EXS55_03485 [Candidatus Magasanikbacteria bacterium]|nr:hypothetical protein [Candidatus Magasanikbacteria bacterium]